MDSANLPALANYFVAGVSIVLLLYVMQKKNAPAAPTDSRLLEMADRMQSRIDSLERESDSQRAKIMSLEMWAVRLSAQVVKLGGEPVPFSEISQAQSTTVYGIANDRATLLGILREHFSNDELDAVAVEIGMREGALGEGSIDARAARMVQFAQRQNMMLDLAFILWRDRPEVVEAKKTRAR